MNAEDDDGEVAAGPYGPHRLARDLRALLFPEDDIGGDGYSAVFAAVKGLKEKPHVVDYLTVEQRYRLDEACRAVNEALETCGSLGVYIVGSVMLRSDFRDVDVRAIVSDEWFARLYPNADPKNPARDAYWLLSMVSLSSYLRGSTRLPVDFQVQQQTAANEEFPGPRNAIGLGHARAKRRQ